MALVPASSHASGGVSLPVDVAPGTIQDLISSSGLPNAIISGDVGDAPNLGSVQLSILSDDAGPARLAILDGGTEDGVLSLSTFAGIYAQPRSGASAGGTIVEVTDTTGSDAFVVENDGKIGFFGHAPAARPTGVAVTAAAIHAALVSLGLITA